MTLSHLLLRRFNSSKSLFSRIPNAAAFSSFSTAADSANQSPPAAKPSSLSARMSFIFEQIDEIEKKREDKDETLNRIRAWRESKKPQAAPSFEPPEGDLKAELLKTEASMANSDVKKEVELVHPWAEWIELMERLVQQNYFDHRRKDEDGMMRGLGLEVPGAAMEDSKQLDFSGDFKTVQNAVINFGRDRFDILRSLSKQDLQILVGYGCPSTDKREVFSAKLLRKHVHLDEGDVCSSCSLRGSCEKAYLLTNKEDEPRTIDIMRVLLAYGFDPINGSVENKSLLKMKSVKTVVRKLLHQVVKLSSVPIDPNLPPPVFKKPPPKVKQPPPPPRKRVGRNDVEMKKGDWLCPKCDFLNFAKNNVCLQCDAKRPKRQLLPGEWECPECNFLNYRRNTACFHCEHKRPPDTYPESQFPEKQHGPRMRMDKPFDRKDVSNAWNFDFDDNESDGADVATFENADSHKLNGSEMRNGPSKVFERGYSDSNPARPGVGFNDFDEDDDDDVDSYEILSQNEVPKTSRIDFSELEADSESEDVEVEHTESRKPKYPIQGKRQMRGKSYSEDEVAFDTDDDLPVHPKWKSSHVANQRGERRGLDDDDLDISSDSEDETLRTPKRGNRRDFDSDFDLGRNRNRETRGMGVKRSSFSNDFDSGANRNNRGNREKSYDGQSMKKTGRRPAFRDESFSESGSDDELSYRRNKQRDNNNRGGRGMAGKKSSFNRDFDSGANRNRGMRSSFNDDFDSGSNRNNRGVTDKKRYFNGDSDSNRNNRGNREKSYDRDSKFSKPRSHREGGSFEKRGGRSNNFDDKSDSERNLRPRRNVR